MQYIHVAINAFIRFVHPHVSQEWLHMSKVELIPHQEFPAPSSSVGGEGVGG